MREWSGRVAIKQLFPPLSVSKRGSQVLCYDNERCRRQKNGCLQPLKACHMGRLQPSSMCICPLINGDCQTKINDQCLSYRNAISSFISFKKLQS